MSSLSKLSVTSRNGLIGIAAIGTISVAALYYYYYRKGQKSQKSLDDQLSGNKKRKKKAVDQSATVESGSSNDGPATRTRNQASTIEAARVIDMDITIRKDDVSYLIGKGGQNVKKLQRDTDTRILPKETLPNGDRIYTIVGIPSAVELAANQIKLHISSQPIVTATELEVPDQVLGRLIGKRGDNIRQIQVVSGAKIDIPRTSAPEDYFDISVDDPEKLIPQTTTGYHTRKIQVRGNDKEKELAIRLINETVQEELSYRKRMENSARNRRQNQMDNSTSIPNEDSESDYNRVGLGADGVSEFDPISSDKRIAVFVSSVTHPNELWIQVIGPDSIKLDKLCDEMTEYYSGAPEDEIFQVDSGDIVAAPVDMSNKMYRAKVLDFAAKGHVKLMFVDYGDMKTVHIEKIRPLKPEFLKLRFQAREATLNLECPEEKWSDEIITQLVDLSCCAQWTPITAKIIQVLKDPKDSGEKLWVELFTNNKTSALNIGEELIKTLAEASAQFRHHIIMPQSESVEISDGDANSRKNSTDHPAQDTEGSGDSAHVIRRDSLVKNGISYASIASKSPDEMPSRVEIESFK